MLKQSSSKKNSHVVWDEDNLKVNAEIQKEYSAVKIDEPKTPYRPPLAAGELADEEMHPLELDPDDPAAAEVAKAAVTTAFDYVMSNGGADYTPPGPSQRRLQTRSSTASNAAGGADAAADGVGAKRSSLHIEPCTSFNSSGSDGCADPESAEKKRRFEQMRKQHYDMKQALQQAKQLLASEDEDAEHDEPEPEHEDPDTADWKAANGTAAGGSHADQQARDSDACDVQQQGQPPAEAVKQHAAQQGDGQADGSGVQDMDEEQQTG